MISVAANIAPGTNSAEAPPVPAVVPDAVLPAPTVSAPVAPPIQTPPVQMPAPGTYGGPGYPPVEFPGAYLEIPPGVSPTDTTVRWYTITVGLRVGVFPHWYVFSLRTTCPIINGDLQGQRLPLCLWYQGRRLLHPLFHQDGS